MQECVSIHCFQRKAKIQAFNAAGQLFSACLAFKVSRQKASKCHADLASFTSCTYVCVKSSFFCAPNKVSVNNPCLYVCKSLPNCICGLGVMIVGWTILSNKRKFAQESGVCNLFHVVCSAYNINSCMRSTMGLKSIGTSFSSDFTIMREPELLSHSCRQLLFLRYGKTQLFAFASSMLIVEVG